METNKTIRYIKICVALALGVMFFLAAVLTYRNVPTHMHQLTFLSNFITGLFLIAAGILWLCKKSVPQFLFMDLTILLLIVFGVCMVFPELGFGGGLIFLHVLDPLLMLAFFLFLTTLNNTKWQFIITVTALPLAYMVFALIFGACTGDYVYFFLDYNTFGTGYTVLFIFGVLIGVIAVSIGLYFLNRFIHKHILKEL